MSDPFENYDRDIRTVEEANQAPRDTTRRKIPCVSMGRVVNTEDPRVRIVDGRPLSEQ